MKFRLAKIFLFLTLILSIVVILIVLKVLQFSRPWHVVLLYTFVTIFASILSYIALLIAGNQKPREVVKVVYKTVEKAPEKKDDKIVKQEQIVKNYVKQIVKDLDKFTDSLEDYSDQLFHNLAEAFNIVTGMLFLWDKTKQVYYTAGTYAFYSEDTYREYKLGEGITGQVAKDKRILYIDNVPEGYIVVVSGLGKGTPRYLTVLPVVKNNFTVAVIEFATFDDLPEPKMKILEAVAKELANTLPDFVEV